MVLETRHHVDSLLISHLQTSTVVLQLEVGIHTLSQRINVFLPMTSLRQLNIPVNYSSRGGTIFAISNSTRKKYLTINVINKEYYYYKC